MKQRKIGEGYSKTRHVQGRDEEGESTKKVTITNTGKEGVIKIVILLDQVFSMLISIFYVDFQFLLLSYLISF